MYITYIIFITTSIKGETKTLIRWANNFDGGFNARENWCRLNTRREGSRKNEPGWLGETSA